MTKAIQFMLYCQLPIIMEKITKERIERYIQDNKIELSGTHKRLCVPIIDRIYKKMLLGLKFDPIKIDDGLICDGHHRYMASLLASVSLETRPYLKTSATIVVPWDSVSFEEQDWDTPAKIDMLNEDDAAYNEIEIKTLLKLLKDV